MPYRDSPVSPSSAAAEVRLPRSRNATLGLNLLWIVPLLPLGLYCARAVLEDEQLPWNWLVIWAAAVVGWVLFRRRRFQQGLRALLDSQALLNAGSYTAGGECCEEILKRYRGIGAIEASALCNLSVAAYHRGDSAQALSMLDAVERAGWCRPTSALRPVVLQNRTLFHAVLGNLAEAERAAHEARRLMSAARAAATLITHDAVLAARAGRFADVVAVTGTREAMSRLQLKLLRVLRAWALKSTAPETSVEEVRTLLDGTRPVAPGELRYLTAHWPELGAFLVENGLSDAT